MVKCDISAGILGAWCLSDGIHVRAKVADLRRRSVLTWCQCFDVATVELQICDIFLDCYRATVTVVARKTYYSSSVGQYNLMGHEKETVALTD